MLTTALYVCMLCCFSCVRLFVNPWTVAHQAPLSMEFSSHEKWSGVLFSSPGNLPHPGIEPWSPASQVDSLPCKPPGKSPAWVEYNSESPRKEKLLGCWILRGPTRPRIFPVSISQGRDTLLNTQTWAESPARSHFIIGVNYS